MDITQHLVLPQIETEDPTNHRIMSRSITMMDITRLVEFHLNELNAVWILKTLYNTTFFV